VQSGAGTAIASLVLATVEMSIILQFDGVTKR